MTTGKTTATLAPLGTPGDGRAFAVFGWATGAYLVHAVLAVASGRHLFGDAAWFLVRIASEGRATSFVDDFFRQFHHSRALSFWITQGPAVLAAHLGLHDLKALSDIYGASLFGSKVLSLVLCYWLLPAGKKIYFVFPALGLFAGTINSDIYIVSETHLAVSFAWPILISLHQRRGGALEILVCGAAIAVATLLHESFAFFAMIMLALLMLRRWRDGHARDRGELILMALLLVVVAVNLAGIAFPRDPVNRGSFSDGLFKLASSTLNGVSGLHIGPVVSVVTTGVMLAVLLGVRGSARVGGPWLLTGTCVALAMTPVVHFVSYTDSVVLEAAIDDRGFSGLAMQLPLMVGFLAIHSYWKDAFSRASGTILALLMSLVIGQTAWQLMATQLWRDAVADTRSRLQARDGLLTCPDTAPGTASMSRLRAERAICRWWVTPLSIVVSRRARVNSLMISSHESFQAFDAGNPGSLPGLGYVSHDYSRFIAALGSARQLGAGEKVWFKEGGRGVGMIRAGFSSPEAWGTWTERESARIEVCGLSIPSAGSVRLAFHLTPFTPPHGVPTEVRVMFAGNLHATWRFAPGGRDVERELVLPGRTIPATGCVDLEFRMEGLRSPLELGTSGDSRHLGVAFVDLQRHDLP